MSDLPRTMRAAILVELNKPLVVDQVELPAALEWGQVLVRVLYSGICGSQLGEMAGVKGPDPWLPHLLGHEGSGDVVAVGPGVRRVKPGDRVVLHWMEAPGIAAAPPVYSWQGRRLNAGFVTTFNEYCIAAENRLTPVSADLDPRLVPLLGCAVTTGLGVVNNKAKVKIGQSVAVFGAGGVGLNVIQGAALAGAHPIVAVDIFANRLALAGRFGATHQVNSREEDPEAAIRAAVGPQGADVVVDNTGLPEVIGQAYRLTAAKGRTVLVGVPRAGAEASLYTLPLHFGKEITGTKGGETRPEEDIPRYVRLMQAGRLDLAGLVTEELDLAEVNAAVARMRSGEAAGRIILKVGAP